MTTNIFVWFAISIICLVVLLIIFYSVGYNAGRKYERNKPCTFCGHKPADEISMAKVNEELDKNFKELDALAADFLHVWKSTRCQIDLYEKDLKQKIIDAHMD